MLFTLACSVFVTPVQYFNIVLHTRKMYNYKQQDLEGEMDGCLILVLILRNFKNSML